MEAFSFPISFTRYRNLNFVMNQIFGCPFLFRWYFFIQRVEFFLWNSEFQKAGSVLSELSQSSSLQQALAPLSASLVQKKLLQHKDKDIKILLAVCFCEVIRILAPAPPFSDEILKVINFIYYCCLRSS